jgi:para-nitrobenzyl esterase
MNLDITTSRGAIRGSDDGGVAAFKGIPFAAPPVGDLRFRAPQPVKSWSGVRDCTAFSAVAPQLVPPGGGILPRQVEPQSEDCLYLNVWTPAADAGKRPVMVWIHGGGFTGGSGSSAWYSGANLARRGDVVCVTVNYRLGALGFLHDPAFGDAPGNFGQLDQVAALRWVADEIAAFGGDPSNVTIFGESAGGMSVGNLMGSPLAKGLFQKAIPQSGASHNALSPEEAAAVRDAYFDAIGAHLHPDALRALPVEQILEAQGRTQAFMGTRMAGLAMPFQPVVDGSFLETRAIDAVRGGMSAGVATLVGSCADEWKLFTSMMPGGGEGIDEGSANRRTGRLGGGGEDADLGEKILGVYRTAHEARGAAADPLSLFEAAMTDFAFRVPADRLAEAQAAHNPLTFAYRFDWPSPALEGRLGACHAVEIPFVFGTTDVSKAFSGSGEEADALSATVMDAWLAFAKTGTPSTDALPWRAFDAVTRPTMILDRNCHIEEQPREAERRAWDGVIS